jgi:4-oxalocrotonate tautomerase
MPFVTIHWFKGRTAEQKAKIAEAVTKAFVEAAGIPQDQVFIIFIDLERENVAKAGRLASTQPP